MNDEAFTTLHRHWVWCKVMKKSFNQQSYFSQFNLDKNMTLWASFSGHCGAYMSVWYGLLYSVLETLRKNKIVIESIENEIADIYRPLKRYRNAVFHPQPKYWADKLFPVVTNENMRAKIQKVHEALDQYFDEEFSKRGPGITAYRYEHV